jgi:hypothetical protein
VAEEFAQLGKELGLELLPPRAVYPWPEKIRVAQTLSGDFSKIAYAGVSHEEALTRDPNRTAVDDIREALQRRNADPLLSAAKRFSFSNLITNPGFVACIQDLQDRGRRGDKWAKTTLTAVGRALGDVVQGPTSTLSPEARQANRRAQNSKSSAKRNARAAAKRLAKKIQKEEAWLIREKRKTPTAARREAIRQTIDEWQVTSRAQDKPAILANLKEILSGD